MKSSIKFDLNGQNQAVVKARICLTDDVRDKVAKQFTENLGHESCIAIIGVKSIHVPDEKDPSQQVDWEIKTLNPFPKDCNFLVKHMSDFHLSNMLQAIQKEQDLRRNKNVMQEQYMSSGVARELTPGVETVEK